MVIGALCYGVSPFCCFFLDFSLDVVKLVFMSRRSDRGVIIPVSGKNIVLLLLLLRVGCTRFSVLFYFSTLVDCFLVLNPHQVPKVIGVLLFLFFF